MQRADRERGRFDGWPRGRLADQRGIGLLAVLVALLVAAALYVGYFRVAYSGGRRPVGVQAIDASRALACRTQRQQIERDLVAWTVTHADAVASLEALAADGIRVPGCPEGGRYTLRGQVVSCSVHE